MWILINLSEAAKFTFSILPHYFLSVLYLKKMNARLAILEFFCWNIITFQYFVFKPVPQSQLQSLNCKTRTISTVCRVFNKSRQTTKRFWSIWRATTLTLDLMGWVLDWSMIRILKLMLEVTGNYDFSKTVWWFQCLSYHISSQYIKFKTNIQQ